MPSKPPQTDDLLAKKIRSTKPGEEPLIEKLETSDRVLRRVTDGIYREPWAAIRELISNAYDADATEVVISTDQPRFQEITIRDNGNGFTAEALATMCKSIGGSAKRTRLGKGLGITSDDDPDLSPGGRRLIGKLGIGLFAVSQLAQQFRIVTKVAGESERIVADIVLFRYSEGRKNKSAESSPELEATGEIQITKIKANDIEAHGTDIIIDKLLPRARDEFQSRDIWNLIRHPPTEAEGGGTVIKPTYHIGFTEPPKRDSFVVKPSVPWDDKDTPIDRFKKLAQAMYDRVHEPATAGRRPSLSTTFDNYLRFVWLNALSAPIDYLEQHPFDLTGDSGTRIFHLGKMKSGRAEEIELRPDETIRNHLKLKAPERGGSPEFKVIMDGMELRRPIRFTELPQLSSATKTPLLFVGSDSPNMSKFPALVTGGPLRFEGYLLWTPRVVPLEHNGVLIRIADSSGELFDETFMRYQISEQTRKEQVTAEIFVHEGMDAALNIDREGFNYSHPHYQYIAAWVHDAFKQLATKHKSLGAEQRKRDLARSHVAAKKQLQAVVEEIVDNWSDGDEQPIPVEFVNDNALSNRKDTKGVLLIGADTMMTAMPAGIRITAKKATQLDENQTRIAAIAQVLYAAGVLDKLSLDKRQKLIADLARIIFFRAAE